MNNKSRVGCCRAGQKFKHQLQVQLTLQRVTKQEAVELRKSTRYWMPLLSNALDEIISYLVLARNVLVDDHRLHHQRSELAPQRVPLLSVTVRTGQTV